MTKENEDILFYAFRYALGRKTGVVYQMVDILIHRWQNISISTREQIQREIKHAMNMETAGDECDVREWFKILDLKIQDL